MSVTKVSNLHESATALDMIGDRVAYNVKNVPVATRLQLQMAGQIDLQVGHAISHLLVSRKIPNVLSKSVLYSGPQLSQQIKIHHDKLKFTMEN